MREYLFRGKRVDNGERVEGYLGVFKGKAQIYVPFTEEEEKENEWHIFSAIGGLWYMVEPESVGQYTGMNDKNGRKIFEGDICRIKIPHEDQSLDKYELAKVIFEDGYFEIITRYGDIFHHYWLTLEYVEKPEVIGTVFENADLLESD